VDGVVPAIRPAEVGERPTPRVTVIVPCRNEVASIQGFLKSLLEQDISEPFEVIVADGESNDGTREVLDQFALDCMSVRVLGNPQKIVSTGLNAAIGAARSEIIVRMDVHTDYAPDYLRQCVDALRSDVAENVGGAARTRARTRFQKANAVAYQSMFAVGGARFHNPEFEGYVDTVTYGCWYKQTLIELGLFDEELTRNQDDELNHRLRLRGGRVWQTPKIRSWYYPRDSIGKLYRQYFQYGFWKVASIRKHKSIASWRHVVPAGALLLLLVLALASMWFEAPRWILVAGVGAYVVLSLLFSAVNAIRERDFALFFILPLVFVTYHAAYAAGFSRSLLGTLFRLRRPSAAGELTR
jgi:succinoglycan biosynthesis protein ExoA